MKLNSEALMRHLFSLLVARSSNRDDSPLPLVEIDGVECSIDSTSGIVKTKQAWYEIVLHDVTPKRFLSANEQLKLMNSEQKEWWMVTGSKVAFVKAESRSKAMAVFSTRYHETPVDCELARGFNFIDDATPDEAGQLEG